MRERYDVAVERCHHVVLSELRFRQWIFEFTGDRDYYENKIKVGSLHHVLLHQRAALAIDSQFKFYQELDFSGVYDSQNSFR